MNLCLLQDRAIVAVSGDDAEGFLNRLFTNSILGMEPGVARYAALLSPQGKLLFDFLVLRCRDAFWIDCQADQAGDLAGKLSVFKLRAKVAVAVHAELAVAAAWNGVPADSPGAIFRDPRHDGLGWRIVAARDVLESFAGAGGVDAYEAHRIALGIPKGGVDFVYGDTFVHDANLDLVHGVDFDKGCYVGQEVVSRVHHRNSARKRIVKLHFYGDPPSAGAPLVAGALRIGAVTSLAAQELGTRVGLAVARTDRLAEAEASNAPVLAGETLVGITLPSASTVRPMSHAQDGA